MLWRMPAGLSLGRIGIMFSRLHDLPAVPALDGATSPSKTDVDSGPIYGAKDFPVAGGRSRAMLFRTRAEPIGKAVAETAETGASPKRRTSVLPPPWCALIPLDALRRKRAQLNRTTGSSMVAANDSQGAPKERHGPPDLDRRPATHHRRTACCDPRQDPGRARRAVDRLPEALPLRPGS